MRGEQEKQLVTFCDSVSNIHLVRRVFAKEAGWRGTPVRQPITTAGGEAKVWDFIEYWVPFIKSNKSEVRVLALTMDQITEDLRGVDISKAA